MKLKNTLFHLMLISLLAACTNPQTESSESAAENTSYSSVEETTSNHSEPPLQENCISLYSDTSRYYFDSLKEEDSCPLKTYHHKDFGEIPYVSLSQYCDTFDMTIIQGKREYGIKEDQFYVTNQGFGTFLFDAKKDTVTTSGDILYFFKDNNNMNNFIPLDIYTSTNFERFTKGSKKTRYISTGKERVYDCKKYDFDIVYENGEYYAPFSLLNALFFEFKNETSIYNGKDFFDAEYLSGENPVVQYCYSSNGNFLLDLSGGKFGPALFENKEPNPGEEYHFETTIKASGQKFVFSLANGTGFIRSYNFEGKLIEEDVYKKVKYVRNGDILEMKYFSVFNEDDDEKDAISDIYTLNVHMDETLFHKKKRSKEVADFTYQELRFAMMELYGKTINEKVKDFDTFIQDKDYKEKLLSLDAKEYDDAMSQFLLQGIDDGHTSIDTPSIYGLPTMAEANSYQVTFEGPRYNKITSTFAPLREKRKEANLDEGLDIVGETAVLSFDKFVTSKEANKTVSLKAYPQYQNTNPNDYVTLDTMAFFASSFQTIEKNANIKNVVFDLTCNSGGKTATMAYLLSYLTDDPTIRVNNLLNDSYIEFHYMTDLDQDGVYASNKDTFKDKYQFYVLTSHGSFSCGNHFPSLCKDNGLAKIIGERSAGGSCVISSLSNSSGYLYHSSSEHVAVIKEGDKYVNNDAGVTPDIELDSSYWYDHSKLNQYLKTLS
ncbi:MAG: hypothetical protein IJ194_02965 [Bacilli bacterium]|nr:hypothetical protein [Bacilli bacterium]